MSAPEPFRISTGNCVYQPDFYEDDEPVEKVKAAFEAGEKAVTAAPTAAETLAAAADRLDALLKGTTDGPWWYDESDQCWRLHGVHAKIPTGMPGWPDQIVNKQILKAPKQGTPYAEYWPSKADGDWIVTMNPVVGRALVAMLRSEARVYDSWESVQAVAEQRGLAVLVSGSSFDEALALARAILGEVAS